MTPVQGEPGGRGEHQTELPFAVVQGVPISDMPHDLHIPPDALEVFLEAFEGPLDLLLYLIKRQNIDILDIPLAEITEQYVHYIDLMEELQLELAGEYLVMAAMLAEIKSRMLLPGAATDDDEEEDPRATLVRRLQEYERYRTAASQLDTLPRCERDTFAVLIDFPERRMQRAEPGVELDSVLQTFAAVLNRAEIFSGHHVAREPLSIRERMASILERVGANQFVDFSELFTPEEGRAGVIVTLLAVLELIRSQLLGMLQSETGSIHLRAVA